MIEWATRPKTHTMNNIREPNGRSVIQVMKARCTIHSTSHRSQKKDDTSKKHGPKDTRYIHIGPGYTRTTFDSGYALSTPGTRISILCHFFALPTGNCRTVSSTSLARTPQGRTICTVQTSVSALLRPHAIKPLDLV